MAPLIIFAFGPSESYFLETPRRSYSRRLGWAFQAIRPNISLYFALSLGPGDNDYAAFYTTHDGKLRYSMNYPYEPLLKSATEWLMDTWKKSPADAVSHSRLSVGPGGRAYVAVTPTDVRYENVPEGLLAILKTCIVDGLANIMEVSLGINGAWWARFRDGSCQWDLAGRYLELDRVLKGGEIDMNSVESVALSPHDGRHWFLLYERYKVRYSLPAQFAAQVSAEIKDFHASLEPVSGVHDSLGSVVGPEAAGRAEELPPSYSESSGTKGGSRK